MPETLHTLPTPLFPNSSMEIVRDNQGKENKLLKLFKVGFVAETFIREGLQKIAMMILGENKAE